LNINFDHSLLLDFLTSSETSFLEYLIIYPLIFIFFLTPSFLLFFFELFFLFSLTIQSLQRYSWILGKISRKMRSTWRWIFFKIFLFLFYILLIFKKIENNDPFELLIDKIMGTFIRLKYAIENLNQKSLFPYNPAPLLKNLSKIEELYEK